MLGAIVGDIVGSRFEFNNYKHKNFELFTDECFLTDDSIMTLCVADALLKCRNDFSDLSKKTIESMKNIGRKYPDCGYGSRFYDWLFSDSSKPYNSFGNGSAMRVSPVAYVASNIDEVIKLSRAVTEITHSHPEGIRGAEATAVAIYMARSKKSKNEIKKYIEDNYYKLNFNIDDIRSTYTFNEICQNTVPQAVKCFIESESFEDDIRIAISLGGDSDTLAAISGSIAQAYYGVPIEIENKALSYLDDELYNIYKAFNEKYMINKK